METLGYSHRNVAEKAVNFVRVAPIPSVGTGISLSVATGCAVYIAENQSQYGHDAALGFVFITVLSLISAGFNAATAANKNLEYRKVKESLMKRGWDERIIKPKSHSWCQRHAARRAAIETGYKNEIDSYYRREGYKWYHILPYMKSAVDERS